MDNPTGRVRTGGDEDPSWGPAPWISSLTLLGMLAALVWRFLDHDPEDQVVAAVLVAVCALVTLALVRIRVRLRVVADGIVVTGPLRSRSIAWSQIRTISTARRGRFGLRNTLLELEVRAAEQPAGTGGRAAGGRAAGGRPGIGDGDAADPDDPDADELVTFGQFDLGTDPAQVARELRRRRNLPR